MYHNRYGCGCKIESMVGKRIKQVEGVAAGSEQVKILFEDGDRAVLEHQQDCCENVRLEDTEGSDAADFEGALVHEAYESSREATGEEASESGTWTFYRVVTSKGVLVLRWLGTSNGYYSEGVDFHLHAAGEEA